jgi:hypothetical protein
MDKFVEHIIIIILHTHNHKKSSNLALLIKNLSENMYSSSYFLTTDELVNFFILIYETNASLALSQSLGFLLTVIPKPMSSQVLQASAWRHGAAPNRTEKEDQRAP